MLGVSIYAMEVWLVVSTIAINYSCFIISLGFSGFLCSYVFVFVHECMILSAFWLLIKEREKEGERERDREKGL